MFPPFRQRAPCAHRSLVNAIAERADALRRAYRSLLLVGTAGLLALSCQHAEAGLNSGPEYATLQAIYNSTDGANWTTSTGWGSGDACSWYGITCDQDLMPEDNTSHVVYISMSYNNLNGPLPDLTGLTALDSLELDNNLLSGSIPALGGMASLRIVTIYLNQLTGSIPALAGMANLEYFSADDNQLTGPIPELAGIPKLRGFSVPRNQLTGVIPDLAGLTAFQHLDVGTNHLTGSIPSLTGLTSLSLLDVRENQLTGSLPDRSDQEGCQSASRCSMSARTS